MHARSLRASKSTTEKRRARRPAELADEPGRVRAAAKVDLLAWFLGISVSSSHYSLPMAMGDT
jgi:hypothetical protein